METSLCTSCTIPRNMTLDLHHSDIVTRWNSSRLVRRCFETVIPRTAGKLCYHMDCLFGNLCCSIHCYSGNLCYHMQCFFGSRCCRIHWWSGNQYCHMHCFSGNLCYYTHYIPGKLCCRCILVCYKLDSLPARHSADPYRKQGSDFGSNLDTRLLGNHTTPGYPAHCYTSRSESDCSWFDWSRSGWSQSRFLLLFDWLGSVGSQLLPVTVQFGL